MTRRAILSVVGFIATSIFLWWLLFVAVPRWFRGGVAPAAPAGAPAPVAGAQPRITATLFFISEDGMALAPVQREVPFAEPAVEQARQVVEAQIARPAPPLASAIPPETKLRAIYLSERGDLFVDLTAEVGTRHTGGALDELFTVYAIVNSVTVTLPAISRVQILIDGKEVDTLAGHVDLRNPLSKNLAWVKSVNPS
ncbi:MAG TPA: GerMN domain-containing protein [Vicinamibacterales bacterium]|nr:GerMN domain-containing protein [Vicinamibacterales bacterium]